MQKYSVPIKPAELLKRPRLLEQIDNMLNAQTQFLFIKAPAGYGKSYLMIDYALHIQQQGNVVISTSLNEDDNQPEFFFTYFLAVLKAQGLVSDGLFFDENISPLSFVYQLLAELAKSKKHLYLIFDDLHHIQPGIIADFFQHLVLNSSLKINIIMASRVDLPFPIAKAYVAGKICKLKAHDLVFNQDEIQQYYDQYNQSLISAEDVAKIFEITGGWPAIISVGKDLSSWKANSSNEENLASYFFEEFVAGLTSDEIQCLFKISITNFLCEPLIASITESTTFASGIVKKYPVMHQHNKYLTERFEWFTLQPLLKDYLFQQLKLNPTVDLKALNLACADWYFSQNIFLEAVHHYIQAEQYKKAVTILETHGTDSIASGNFPRFNILINQLPYNILRSNVYLLVLQAWNYSLTYQHGKGEKVIENLEKMINQNSEMKHHEQIKLLAVKAAHAAWTDDFSSYQHQVEQAMNKRPLSLPHFENALRTVQCIGLLHSNQFAKLLDIGDDASFFAGGGSLFYSTVMIKTSVAMMEFVQGNIDSCLAKCDEITTFINSQQHDSQLAHVVNVIRGLAAYIIGDLELAKKLFDKSGSIASYSAEPSLLAWYYVTHIQLLTDLNLNSERELMIEHLLELLDSRKLSSSKIPLYFEAINYYLITDNPEEANGLYQAFKAENIDTDTPENNHLLFNEQMTDSLMLASIGDLETCKQNLQLVVSKFKASSRTLQQLRCLVSLVNININLEDISAAKSALKKMISMASKKNLVQYFGRLDQTAIGYIHDWAITELSSRKKAFMLDICQRFEGEDLRQRFNIKLVEQLTSAEQKVMELLGFGNSNQQIADQLCLSINTVKTHLKTSYAKLGVGNRIQATQLFSKMQQSQNQ